MHPRYGARRATRVSGLPRRFSHRERLYYRFVSYRSMAESRGEEFPEYGPSPTSLEASENYKQAVDNWIWERPRTATAALALVEFAGVISADKLLEEIGDEGPPVARDRRFAPAGRPDRRSAPANDNPATGGGAGPRSSLDDDTGDTSHRVQIDINNAPAGTRARPGTSSPAPLGTSANPRTSEVHPR